MQLRRATDIGAVDESTCRKATPPAGKRARFLEETSIGTPQFEQPEREPLDTGSC